MLTQALRSRIDNLDKTLQKDFSIDLNDYLTSLVTMKLVEKLKPIILSFKEALHVASDNNEIRIDMNKSISDQAASLSPDIAVLLGYLGQLREALVFHWKIINQTDLTYVRCPSILNANICRDIAGICSEVFFKSREKIHEYEFLMPGIKIIYCMKKNTHTYHQLSEFIFADDGSTPIVVEEFYEELSKPGKFTSILKGYTKEEVERLNNHSNEAYDYFFALKLDQRVTEAKSGFDDAMHKGKQKITYTYGVTGGARLAKGLLEYAAQPCKTFNEKATFILENIPAQQWQHYLQLLTQNVDDQGKIADAIYFKVCTNASFQSNHHVAVKLLRSITLRNPVEIADFMFVRVPPIAWPNFIDILKNGHEVNDNDLLVDDEIKFVAAILFAKAPLESHQYIRLFLFEMVNNPITLAKFFEFHCAGCRVFKELTQTMLPKIEDQKTLIKTVLIKIKNENQFLTFLSQLPNAKENWGYILGLIEPEFLFSLFLNPNESELTDFSALKIKLENSVETYFDKIFISNEKYQAASFYTFNFLYDLIRNQLPDVLSWTARIVGSDSARSSSAKINAAKALRDHIADMVDNDKIDFNIEEHAFFSEYSSAFGNGALYKMKNALKQTGEKLIHEKNSHIQTLALQ